MPWPCQLVRTSSIDSTGDAAATHPIRAGRGAAAPGALAAAVGWWLAIDRAALSDERTPAQRSPLCLHAAFPAGRGAAAAPVGIHGWRRQPRPREERVGRGWVGWLRAGVVGVHRSIHRRLRDARACLLCRHHHSIPSPSCPQGTYPSIHTPRTHNHQSRATGEG